MEEQLKPKSDPAKLAELKEAFLDIYTQKVTREGANEFLKWLQGTDFFGAPASSRFHLSRPGGLLEHSMNVYNRLRALVLFENSRKGTPVLNPKEECSVAICGLLHDVCKANMYVVEMKNRKNADGKWEKYAGYTIKDNLPYGHGEKSVYLISKFMELEEEEAMAIRWHMGGFDDAAKGGSPALKGVFQKYPLAIMTHIADMQASYLDEKDEP